MTVVATIFPLYDMAKTVGGDYAEVAMLIRAGSEVHSFEPTPENAVLLESADILVVNGLGLEPWADKVVSASGNARLTVVDASDGITTIQFLGEDGEGKPQTDPHVFQDPVLAEKQLDNIVSAYVKADPAHEAYYRENGRQYMLRLEGMDGEYRKALADCKTRTVIVNHAFLGYAAKEYNFAQVSLTGLTPESEPLPKDFEAAANAARQAGEDFRSGKTYPQILGEDLEALRKAMGCG
jgi:zinc transport system substrate-binding protein